MTSSISLANVDNLQANLDPAIPAYVLIDPIAGEPIPACATIRDCSDLKIIREAAWQREIVSIVLSKKTPLPSRQHPYLVLLEGPNDSLLELTLELAHAERMSALADGLDGDGGAAHRIGGWLQSDSDPVQLAAALARLCRVKTDKFTKATYLRLADRRVLALLRHVVGDARLAGQFGPLQHWTYLDAHGRAASLLRFPEETAVLRLDSDEWVRMERGEAINRALAQWLGEVLLLGNESPVPQDPYPKLERAIQDAENAARQWPHRFNRLADRTVYAALNLLHPALMKSSVANTLLKEQGTPEEPPEPLRHLHAQLRAVLRADTMSTEAVTA